jgi:hypothetical protein
MPGLALPFTIIYEFGKVLTIGLPGLTADVEWSID